MSAKRPVKRLPPEQRLDELFPQGRKRQDYRLPRPKTALGWFFYLADRVLARYARCRFQPGRETAIKLCTEWIVRRQEADGSWTELATATVQIVCIDFSKFKSAPIPDWLRAKLETLQ